jgi:tetratricopeptide (TPR) repeat protein/tRNA A-37 threonylcarbamoyl transferase component Bud32
MLNSFATVDVPLSPAQALRVNEVCDRFEAAWKAAGPGEPGPRIEDHLADAPEAGRALLLRHLILLDVDYRRLRGEKPAAPEYADRFPSLGRHFLAEAIAPPTQESDPVPEGPVTPRPGGDEVSQVATTVLTPPFEPQLRSDRYVIRRYHAHGGIGEVWLADDAEIGRQVALKRLRHKREGQQERFLVEAQITGQLEHPGIVPVHDLGVDKDGRPFYVMSFIHGRTLKEVLDEYHAGGATSGDSREVQFARLLEVFVKVCQAVAYAHHRGVVHRDLKPDNVMLGPFGEALVLDWGLAKVRNQPEPGAGLPPVHPTYSSGSTATEAGTVMGSPSYMPPEVAEGRAAGADDQTDVYLLGATLYHILTGSPPRQGSSHQEMVELARTVTPPPPRRLKADVPRALEAICQKAMTRRKQERYGSALALAQDVERYLAGAPVSVYREPLPVRAWRWCRWHRRALTRAATAALGLAVVAVAAVVVHEVRQGAEQKVREAQARAAQAERDAAEAEAKNKEAERQTEQRRRREQARLDLGTFRRLAEERYFHAPGATPVGEAIRSADGRRLAYFDSGRGQKAAREAVELADRLGREMDELGMRDDRAALDKELHDLLLVMAQARTRQSPGRKAAVEILDSLKRAEDLRGPSLSVCRLRARCYRALGEAARAGEEEGRAKGLAPTPLDHFLQAEEYRARAFEPAETSGDDLAWRPSPELLDKALAEYRLALWDEPNHFWCHLQLGRCYLARDQGPEALEALGTCIALRPEAPWGYSARGLALGLMRRYDEGEADLERALARDPKFHPARLHRGVLAWLQGKSEQALDDFAAVLNLPEDQRLTEAAYYRGKLRVQRREYAEALVDFDRVAKDDPSFRLVYLSRAQVHFLRGDDSRGLTDLTTFLDLGRTKPFDPKDPQLLARRGRLLTGLVPRWGLSPADTVAKLKLAREELRAAQRLGERSAELFDDLGSVAELLARVEPRPGAWDEALAAYQQSLATAAPDLAVKVHTKRGWIYAQSLDPPQYDKARDDFAAALRLGPTHADAHAGLGFVRALQKALSEALHEAAEALCHGSDDYLLLHNVACVYAVLSQIDEGQAKPHQDLAMDLLRRAVALWRQGGTGLSEVEAIRWDPALRPLSRRPDFQKLVTEEGP